MLAAILATALLFDNHDASNEPANLVAQLGSSRYAQRVAAERELARLGRSALPALLAERDSKDLEVRTRSAALVDQIGRASLLEVSQVKLDLRCVPLGDAVEELARQSGSKLALDPEEVSSLSCRTITLRSPTAVSFWTAVDAVCLAGRVRPSFEEFRPGGPLCGLLTLRDGPISESGPVSDSGPFRIRVASAHHRSEIQFDRPRRETKPSRSGGESASDPDQTLDRSIREFFMILSLSVEPRLSVAANGVIRLSEAIDDRGRSLLVAGSSGDSRQVAGDFGMTPSPSLSVRIDLDYPESPGRRIKLLRGSIPVIVSARKPGPLDVALNGPRGQVHRADGVALSVLGHEPATTDLPATIELAIRPLAGQSTSRAEAWPSPQQSVSYQERLEILDAEGRPIPGFLARVTHDDLETRLTLTVDTRGASRIPTTARLHGTFKAMADVPFEFRDLPIP